VLSEEELQLKARLNRVLGQVNAAPPPVAAVLRKGRIMRTGYNLAISTAVAAVSLAGFAAVGQFGHGHQRQASSGEPGRHGTHWRKEQIVRLGPVAKQGVFAEGIESGNQRRAIWIFRVDTRRNQVRAQLTGSGVWYVGNLKESVNPGSIGTFYNGTVDVWSGVYGVVSKNVTRVAVTLTDHEKLNLYPVAAAGRRWVALLTAPSAEAMTFTAYSGKTELAWAVNDVGPVTWLLPGQHGLAKQTSQVNQGSIPAGSGHRLHWSLVAQAGPWGYCLLLTGTFAHGGFGANDCMSPDTAKSAGVKAVVHGVPPRLARWLVGTAKPSVAYLKFKLAGGKTLRARAVLADSQRFFGLPLLAGQDVASWAAYDKAGHKLYGGTGSPKIDRYTGPLSGTGWAGNDPCALSTKACQRAHGSA
jgi:hypothetical protein